MDPTNDPAYKVHLRQTRKAGRNPLPYSDFCATLRRRFEENVSELFSSAGGKLIPDAPRFQLGTLSVTKRVLDAIPPAELVAALRRHSRGDWGDLGSSDIAQNQRALKKGGRLCSRYVSSAGQPFWIITDADRSVTTALLPEDY